MEDLEATKKELEQIISGLQASIKGIDLRAPVYPETALTGLRSFIEKLISIYSDEKPENKGKKSGMDLEAKVDQLTEYLLTFSDPNHANYVDVPTEFRLRVVFDLDLVLIRSQEFLQNPMDEDPPAVPSLKEDFSKLEINDMRNSSPINPNFEDEYVEPSMGRDATLSPQQMKELVEKSKQVEQELKEGNEPESHYKKILVRDGGDKGKLIEHIDDDQFKYVTNLRGWARFILAFQKIFCTNYVFTSATFGYMQNVVNLIESNGTQTFFHPHRLSQNHFPLNHLKFFGKEVSSFDVEFPGEIPDIKFANGMNLDLEWLIGDRTILLDDQPRYHASQPLRGILINTMEEDAYNLHDCELLKVMLTVFENLFEFHPKKLDRNFGGATNEFFWKGIFNQMAKNEAGYLIDDFITNNTKFGKSLKDLPKRLESIYVWDILQKKIASFCKRSKIYLYLTDEAKKKAEKKAEKRLRRSKKSMKDTDPEDDKFRTELAERITSIVNENREKLVKKFQSTYKKIRKMYLEELKAQEKEDKRVLKQLVY